MAEAHVVQCPKCGSTSVDQLAPAFFKCKYCDVMFSPKWDISKAYHPTPKQPHYPPPPPQSSNHPHRQTINLDDMKPENKWLMIGLLATFVCPVAGPIVWLYGYNEVKKKGDGGKLLLILGLFFGLPALVFGVIFLAMVVASAT